MARASPDLLLRGTYTFRIEADLDGKCGWPVTTFVWPVSVEVAPDVAASDATGWIAFPAIASASYKRWRVSAGPAATELTPSDGTPGPVAAAYDVEVAGGRWVGAAPSRGPDGRGQVTSGTASGASLTLVLPGSDKRWGCGSEARWSLLTRHVDRD